MARNLNIGLFVGRLGSDPVLTYMPNGTGIVVFSIAVQDDWFNRDEEEWVERTQWIGLKAFGENAVRYAERLHKGDLVSVRASVQNNNYEKDGVKIYTYDFLIQDLQVLVSTQANGEKSNQKDEPKSQRKDSGSGKSRGRNEDNGYKDPF